MRISLITEHRFDRTPGGAVWASTSNAYSFWPRYLPVIDQVNVAAHVRDVQFHRHIRAVAHSNNQSVRGGAEV